MSLRLRLICGLLVLAAVGLVTLAGVTYAEQRSFLTDRLDQQVRDALPVVDRQLDGRIPPGAPDPDPGRLDGPGGLLGPGHEDGPLRPTLPPGVVGLRRDASGAVVGRVLLSYDGATEATPSLPIDVPVDRVSSVTDATTGARYRASALVAADGGTTVVAVPLADVGDTLRRLLLVEALVIGGVLVALALLAFVVVGIGLRPLTRIGATAGAIADGDLSHRVTTTSPRTEIGRLGRSLNAMLASLEDAFARRRASEDRLRRFLADASHELRTPLVSIRGYAELFRIGAAREPADVEKAMRRIESESARMGVLVEDLLTLARLDEVRPAVVAAVDVAALVRDAADDARAAAPDRDIEVDVDARPGAAVVSGERDRLAQVVSNLVRNALVHTPPGTPVELSVAREADHVRVEVRDHGGGLPAGDAAALFERFWRAEAGRGRGRAGSGLGLAIVAAIVEAHGGRVSAANAEGGGARFVVELPARGPAPTAIPAGAIPSGSSGPPQPTPTDSVDPR